MSKQIKQMQMDVLKNTFGEIRDMVILSSNKLDCHADNQFRTTLRKKHIHLQMVKNSLARRVFGEQGLMVDGCWEGSTLLAWGSGSLAELSKELDTLLRKLDKVKVKGAISEGQGIPFKAALAMPTRSEAIGRVISLALSPASRLVAQILSPASQIAGQIKTLAEKKPEEEAAEPSAAPAGQIAEVAGPPAES